MYQAECQTPAMMASKTGTVSALSLMHPCPMETHGGSWKNWEYQGKRKHACSTSEKNLQVRKTSAKRWCTSWVTKNECLLTGDAGAERGMGKCSWAENKAAQHRKKHHQTTQWLWLAGALVAAQWQVDQKYRGQMKRPLDSTWGVWHASYRPPGAIERSNREVIWLIWIWDPSLKHWRSCVMKFWRQALVRDLKVT